MVVLATGWPMWFNLESMRADSVGDSSNIARNIGHQILAKNSMVKPYSVPWDVPLEKGQKEVSKMFLEMVGLT